MRIIIPILFIALIIVSGCIGGRQVKTDSNNGIQINTLSASPLQVRTGEMVLIDLEIENVGGTTAQNVQVDLFGVEGQWRDSYGNLLTSTLTKQFGKLKPPYPDRKIPGDFKMAQWDIMTPNIPQGIPVSLPIEARVTYDYNTSGHLKVIAVSEDEYRRKQMNGESIAPPEIINSAGPIKLSIPANYQVPIIVETTTEERYQTHPFKIEFQNVGSGFPITLEDDGRIRGAGGKLTGTIEIYGPGVEFDDCLGVSGGKIINLEDSIIPIRLLEPTGSVPVACSIKIDKTVWANRPEDSIQFIFNIFYRYYTKETVNVVVVGV